MQKYCQGCGIEISGKARMCQTCSPQHPPAYDRQRELLDILTPIVISKAGGLPIIAVKPLVHHILYDVSLEELCTNRSTVSRLVRLILEEMGYTRMDVSSKHSLWMELQLQNNNAEVM